MKRRFSTKKKNKFRDLVPELLCSASDPAIDGEGRASIFDALRKLTGRDMGDDIGAWRKWYVSAYGTQLPMSRVGLSLEELIAASSWLPHGLSG